MVEYYNISAGGMDISLEVDPASETFSKEDVTELVMALVQGAINVEREADKKEKERLAELERQRQRREQMGAKGEHGRRAGRMLATEQKAEEKRHGVSINSLLNKDVPQDLFFVMAPKFMAFLAESVRYGIGFCTPRDSMQLGFFENERIPVLVDKNDSPRTQRILDRIEKTELNQDENEESSRSSGIGGQRKSVREWAKEVEAKKKTGRRRL